MAKQVIKLNEEQLQRIIMEACNEYVSNVTDEGIFDFIGKRAGQKAKNAVQGVKNFTQNAYNKAKEGYENMKADYNAYNELNKTAKEEKKSAKAYNELVNQITKLVSKYEGYINNKQMDKINKLVSSLKKAGSAMLQNMKGTQQTASEYARGAMAE